MRKGLGKISAGCTQNVLDSCMRINCLRLLFSVYIGLYCFRCDRDRKECNGFLDASMFFVVVVVVVSFFVGRGAAHYCN